ncbi:type VII secretion protein EccCa [Streptomyces sp. NPDC087226]|uniref:type VII secretion protein EccCa n=1 Tax=Streptomyces sp. NPDC087226 TaxID=3365771 RepID=UPI0038264902
MSVVHFRRPARRQGPQMPEGEIALQEPPVMSEMTPSGSSNMLMFLPMGLMSGAMLLLYIRPGQTSSVMTYLVMGIMVVAILVMLLGQMLRNGEERKQKLKGARRDYLRYLGGVRRRVRAAVVEQQRALAWRHPAPGALWSFSRTSRLWERRPSDPDFGEVRVAVGEQRLSLQLSASSSRPVEDFDPFTAHSLRAFVNAYSTVPDQPIGIFLPAWARVLLRGDREDVLGMARAFLGQLVVMHSPQEVVLALCTAPERRQEWDWVKWIPHVHHPHDSDAAGPVRFIASTLLELQDLLGEDFANRPRFDSGARAGAEEPLTVVVVDGGQVPAGHELTQRGLRNVVVVDLSGELPWRPGRTTLRLEVEGGELRLIRTDRSRKESATVLGRADRLGPHAARALASVLAPKRTGAMAETADPLAADIQLTGLLNIPDLTRHDPAAYWDRRTGAAQRLRVPIAVGVDGRPVELDIKESAENGMGPHGILIGATGSGKSELLRTLVLSLALTHSSETLNFVLVDFKGGATFLGLDELPHISAVITNLADEAALVDRMQDALHGELIRRQELLRAAGNFTSALDYEKARAAGEPLSPLPSLFVVVDEFSELLAAHREFMDLFVMIGRLGRSLGVHLLLASQRLDEGRMHQLESHLSYRIGLRTFSAMESRGILGVPDAYELPAQPGAGYLKSGVEPMKRFRAAYVSGIYRRRSSAVQARAASQVVAWSGDWVRGSTVPAPQPVPEEEPEGSATMLALAVERLRDSGPPAHQVWLPPLTVPPTLDALLPPLTPHPELGLTSADWSGRGSLRTTVGVVDRPFEQKRDLLTVDLSGVGGHAAIAGGPQSGKSTLVRTLVTALALTHTPLEIQFYCFDFGGGGLSQLADLPHVGSVAGRLDTERVSRTLAEMTSLLRRRERLFLERGIDSMATFRRRRAAGELPDEEHGDVFVVVDGWSTVRQDYQDDIATFNELAARGLSYGIHLVTTTGRWSELAAQVRDQAATRIELRVGDAIDSAVDMRKAATVPRIPGRGLTFDTKLHLLTALPRIDGLTTTEDLADGLADLVTAVRDHWHGPVAPPVRMLPLRLDAAGLPPAPQDRPLAFALGVEETELKTAWHDFAETPHLVTFGDTESGKTNLLRLVASEICRRYTREEARILAVDYRRTLVEDIPEEYRLGHAVSNDQLVEQVGSVADAMRTRMPGPDVSPAQMRRADWWRGPRVFVLVDDYDMVANPVRPPFDPLAEFLTLGYEVGLHMVVSRSAVGGMRGVNDPLVRRLLEVNTPGLLLSCPPSEGALFGSVKPRLLPPGRGTYITRRKAVLYQTALVEPGGPRQG